MYILQEIEKAGWMWLEQHENDHFVPHGVFGRIGDKDNMQVEAMTDRRE